MAGLLCAPFLHDAGLCGPHPTSCLAVDWIAAAIIAIEILAGVHFH